MHRSSPQPLRSVPALWGTLWRTERERYGAPHRGEASDETGRFSLGVHGSYDDQVVKYVTTIERFQHGDYPMVCVRSGLPATKMVPVQARRTTVWPWFLLPLSLIWFVVMKWAADADHPWGKLPFAEGYVNGIEAQYEKSIGVIIDGVHPDFVDAARQDQGKAPNSDHSSNKPDPRIHPRGGLRDD